MTRTRQGTLVVLFALASACAEPGAEDPSAAAPSAEARAETPELTAEGRSPDELEPDREAPPSHRATGAPLAALHTQALRQRASDPTAAAGLLEGACEQGFGPSCLAYAEMLERGQGVEADPDAARAVLEAACFSETSTAACDRLGH